VGPGGQWGVHQLSDRVEHREIYCRTRAVQVRDEAEQSVRHRLFAPHARQSGRRSIETLCGLFDGADQ